MRSAPDRPFDLLVVGGGVNGAGIARDAAGRGLSVLLVEKDDLAQGTSSRSSKLIHGGLRYLEYREFRLVREALIEREVLLAMAPHIVWPMRFVLPHSPEQRPRWLVRLGLFLYDHLGGLHRLPGTRSLDLRRDPEGAPIRAGFAYSDCWVDDARLVVLNALDAARRGATILTRTALASARVEEGLWRADLVGRWSGPSTVWARAVVNAAGPWVEQVFGQTGRRAGSRHVRMVKGSHLVVPRFWDGPQGYLIQNDDGRVVFVLPYEGEFALIGTTDIPYSGDPAEVAIDDEEVAYLLRVVNRYFKRSVGPADIVHTLSGVRPLHDDAAASAAAVTRDYAFALDPERPGEGRPPLLSVFGGKITTYRKLAEHAMERLVPFFPAMTGAWTRGATLPGGDMMDGDFETFRAELARAHPALPDRLRTHYARLYGTDALVLLRGARGVADLGRHWGGLLFQCEVGHLVTHEWAMEPDDILWRRTKHGLHLSPEERERFAQAFAGHPSAEPRRVPA